MDVEALEVIDVAIFRQEAGGLADEGGREDLPSLGWPLDRRGEATRLRQDFRADSLPTDIDVRPGTTYAVMATVSASDPQGGGTHVGYLRPTSVRYRVDGHSGAIGEEHLGLESYAVFTSRDDLEACEHPQPRWAEP